MSNSLGLMGYVKLISTLHEKFKKSKKPNVEQTKSNVEPTKQTLELKQDVEKLTELIIWQAEQLAALRKDVTVCFKQAGLPFEKLAKTPNYRDER